MYIQPARAVQENLFLEPGLSQGSTRRTELGLQQEKGESLVAGRLVIACWNPQKNITSSVQILERLDLLTLQGKTWHSNTQEEKPELLELEAIMYSIVRSLNLTVIQQ